MRKIIALFLSLALAISLPAGCAAAKPQESAASEAPAGVSEAAGMHGDPSSSYNAYLEMKSGAYDRISSKLESGEELYMSVGMSLFTIGIVDTALIPLTIISAGEGSKTALEMMGATDIGITHNGNDYTLTYNDPDKGSVTVACKYDPAADSAQSTVSNSTGKEQMFFEYVSIGNGYASQYYLDTGEGMFKRITSFLNGEDTAAFGVESVDARPDSIIGNTSLTKDFVINGEAYFILEGDSLTVLENGEPKTY
jgi:hypothetical protein